jgi:hypothetical protein
MLHSILTRVNLAVQKLRGQTKRVRMLGEKALQQVEQALQGGQHRQQGVSDGSVKGAPPAPQRSQADADLAMQMLLVSPAERSNDCPQHFVLDPSATADTCRPCSSLADNG